MEFPTYLSFQANPGYNISILNQFGFPGEPSFFYGRVEDVNDTTHITWRYENYSVEGSFFVLFIIWRQLIWSLDIYRIAKFDVSEVLGYDSHLFYNTFANDKKQWNYLKISLRDVLMDKRVSYPTDRLTFSINNLTRHKTLRWLNLEINLNGKHDIQLLLEDSRRNNNELLNKIKIHLNAIIT